MQIYILIDNQPKGPYSPEDVRNYLKTGQLQPTDLGAYAGSADWKPLDEMVKSWGSAAPAVGRYTGVPPNAQAAKGKSPLVITAIAIGVLTLLAVVGLVSVKTIHALRHQPDIQGAWEGMVQMPGNIKVRVVLHVSATNGTYHASSDCIDMRLESIPIAKFSYDYPVVEIADKDGGTFHGKLNGTADEMTGDWKQAGQSATVALKRTATPDAIPALLTDSDYAPKTGSDLQGYWKGTLHAGSLALRVVFKIAEPSAGRYVAELDSLDQGANNIVVSAVTYDRPTIRMEVGMVGGVFQGETSSDGTKITGKWTQAGSPMKLTLERSDPNADLAAAAANDAGKDYSHTGPDDLAGHWQGALSVQGMKLHLALHIGKLPNGDLSGSLDSIDQGAKGIPANFVRFNAPDVRMGWSTIGGTFDGKLQNGKITGKWRQAGKTFPMVFNRRPAS